MFEEGRIYNRQREIHGKYGGQSQGGMSTPKDHPVIFLFTGEGGESHGYRDEFRPDGTYWYTGEGQHGDMQFVRSNRALRDHRQEGKRVHLFEALKGGAAKYVGEAEYLGHHYEERPDTNGDLRQAIVFELGMLTGVRAPIPTQTREPLAAGGPRRPKALEELRRRAMEGVSGTAGPEERRRNVYVRAEAVRQYVLARASGHCEGCGTPAPFKTKRGQPYLEPHHTHRVADGGPDHPAHVIALCPTCHRRVHHGSDGEEYNEILKLRLVEAEGNA